MSLEAAVVTELKTVSALTALVSTRIYQLILPQHPTFPAVRVQTISLQEIQHLTAPSGLFTMRLQIDAYTDANTPNPYDSVTAIMDAIHAGLNAIVSSDIGGSPATHRIRGIELLDGGVDLESEELELIRYQRDYSFQYTDL